MKIIKYIKKTVVYSLLAATILSASPAGAAPIVYTNFNQGYRTYERGYVISSGYNRGNRNNNNTPVQTPVEQKPVIEQYPVWTWTVVTTRPSTRPGTVV